MKRTDETQFENYLREFEPRKPRALPSSQNLADGGWRRFAAAAILLAACSASVWFAWPSRPVAAPDLGVLSTLPLEALAQQKRPSHPSLIVLTRLAANEPQNFEVTLNEQSRQELPRLDQPSSALRVLAKE